MPDSLTTRELFSKLLETMDKNQQFQNTMVQVLSTNSASVEDLSDKIEALQAALNNKMWMLIAFLIVAVVALVGVKMALPLF